MRSFRRKSCFRCALLSLLVLFLYNISFSLMQLVFMPDAFTLNRFLNDQELNLQTIDCKQFSEVGAHWSPPVGAAWFLDYGYINLFTWSIDDFCVDALRDVLWHPLYPGYPNTVEKVPHVYDDGIVKNHAIRKFTFFLRPKFSGTYRFSIGVKGGLLLRILTYRPSAGHHGSSIHSCVSAEIESAYWMTSHTTKPIALSSDTTYLFDLIHWTSSEAKLGLLWKPPWSSYFSTIDTTSIAPFVRTHNSTLKAGRSVYDSPIFRSPLLPGTDLSRKVNSDHRLNFFRKKQKYVRHFINASYCHYEPSYLSNGTVEPYTGLYKIREGRYFPDYHIMPVTTVNATLEEATASRIAKDVVSALSTARGTDKRHRKGLFSLERIVYIEENKETKAGYRYFVELDVRHQMSNQSFRVADFVYKRSIRSPICFPRSFIGKRNSRINIVFTTSGYQTQWVRFTLQTIFNIMKRTGERNIHIVVADFSTIDLDLERELEYRGFKYTILHLPGKFNKVKGINRAVQTIKDPNSIVFTIDLHIKFPIYIFDEVRKNTIFNKTVYAPVLIRLPCGKHIEYTDGYGSSWVANGFGVLSMYKRDWDRVGGLDEKNYGEKWGGEDWDIIDRIIAKRYEVIQRRLPGYYHIYHSRKKSAWYQ